MPKFALLSESGMKVTTKRFSITLEMPLPSMGLVKRPLTFTLRTLKLGMLSSAISIESTPGSYCEMPTMPPRVKSSLAKTLLDEVGA